MFLLKVKQYAVEVFWQQQHYLKTNIISVVENCALKYERVLYIDGT